MKNRLFMPAASLLTFCAALTRAPPARALRAPRPGPLSCSRALDSPLPAALRARHTRRSPR